MDALIERIESAKTDKKAMDNLVSDYLPFIKKTISELDNLGMEYDDRLSLALLSFMVSVKHYKPDKGSFIKYAATSIRHRLIDECKKQLNYQNKIIQIFPEGDDDTEYTLTDKASIIAYQLETEREDLTEEIDEFSGQLMGYSITFDELAKICPRQKRARNLCNTVGRYAADTEHIRVNLLKHRRLAQSELAEKFDLSEKTIEKHRKYIVALILLYSGDYPYIRSFLPKLFEVK